MDSVTLIDDSLKLLSLVCLNPFSFNLMNRIFGKCATSIVMCTVIDCSLILSFTYQGIDSTMEILFLVAAIQILTKVLFLLVNKKEIIVRINNIRTFSKPNPDNFDQQEKNNQIFAFVKFSIRSYIILLFLIIVLLFARPLLNAEIFDLPWKSCCSKFLQYKVCYAFELLYALVLVLIQLSFESLYISFITNIICEFKLIEKQLSNLRINPMVCGTDKEAMDQLTKLIDHHNLLLECTKIMKHVYRVPLLGLFLANMFTIGFSMIIMTSKTSGNTIKLIFGGMLMMFYLIQLFFYCITGTLLANESMKISHEVYKSNWWVKTQPELQKSLIMVMRRSNKPEILTAGEIIELNLETFVMILKSSFSFFTFMQVLYEKSE